MVSGRPQYLSLQAVHGDTTLGSPLHANEQRLALVPRQVRVNIIDMRDCVQQRCPCRHQRGSFVLAVHRVPPA
jgi:hypothetical protein